jgi:hypothetical protein
MTNVNDQRGIALVLALIMLMLLSILGTFALTTSSTELFIAGNYRDMQRAFYAGDAALELVLHGGSPNLYKTLAEGATSPTPGTGTSLKNKDYNTINFGGITADVKVKYLGKGKVPTGGDPRRKYPSGDDFEAAFYLISTTGVGPNGAMLDMEALTYRVVQKASS